MVGCKPVSVIVLLSNNSQAEVESVPRPGYYIQQRNIEWNLFELYTALEGRDI